MYIGVIEGGGFRGREREGELLGRAPCSVRAGCTVRKKADLVCTGPAKEFPRM